MIGKGETKIFGGTSSTLLQNNDTVLIGQSNNNILYETTNGGILTPSPSTQDDKYLIREWYSFKGNRKLIEEAEMANRPVVMSGIMQKANTENRNGRVYPLKILQREVTKYMEAVKERRAMGELDHPESAVVSLSNASHIVTELWWEGETLMGKVELLPNPAGELLKGFLRADVMLGISSRGVGSVKSQDGKDVVQEDFELIAFDFVSSPSTPGAYLFKEAKQWGLTPMENVSAKIIKPDECSFANKSKCGLINLSQNDFWSV